VLVPDATAVRTGHRHACSLRDDGRALCWGDNSRGQLGDGTTRDRAEPVLVDLDGIHDLALGRLHTCAMRRDGTVWCWGNDDEGELGRGGGPSREPARVSEAGHVDRVTVGATHACAIDAERHVRCWGNNDYGQLAVPGSAMERVPRRVTELGAALAVSSGHRHTCSVSIDRGVWCWGDNRRGQVAPVISGSRCAPAANPRRLSRVSEATRVVTGYSHSCALLDDGGVSCWGDNASMQLGTETTGFGPVIVPLDDAAIAISACSDHTCALLSSGAVWCWGAVGTGRVEPGGPRRVELPQGARSVATGAGLSWAVTLDGRVYRWGTRWGRSSDGRDMEQLTEEPSFPTAVEIAAGSTHACIRTADGAVHCAGSGNGGALLASHGPDRLPLWRPARRVGGLPDAVSLSAGGYTTCIVSTEGDVWCWGAPMPTFDPEPAPVEGLPR